MCSLQRMSKFNSVAYVIGSLTSRGMHCDHYTSERQVVRVNIGAFLRSSICLFCLLEIPRDGMTHAQVLSMPGATSSLVGIPYMWRVR